MIKNDRLNIRIPKALKDQLKRSANRRGVTISELILNHIKNGITGKLHSHKQAKKR